MLGFNSSAVYIQLYIFYTHIFIYRAQYWKLVCPLHYFKGLVTLWMEKDHHVDSRTVDLQKVKQNGTVKLIFSVAPKLGVGFVIMTAAQTRSGKCADGNAAVTYGVSARPLYFGTLRNHYIQRNRIYFVDL